MGPWNHAYKRGPFSPTWHRDDTLIESPGSFGESGHVTDLIAAEATRWIESRTNRPFFLYVPFTAVHLPIKEPDEWMRRVPASFAPGVPSQYAACVMHLDDAVGRILSALDKTRKRERTLVVFTSDNGGSPAENNDTQYPGDVYPSGALTGDNRPLRGHKGQFYEGGIRVPAIVSWPGKLRRGKYEAPVHIADWMPTLCAITSAKPAKPLNWDGQDVWPLLTGKEQPGPRRLYWAGTGFRTQAVRVGNWKLIVTNPVPAKNSGGRDELFDLASDPNETNDLGQRMPAKVEELRAALKELASADRDAVAKD